MLEQTNDQGVTSKVNAQPHIAVIGAGAFGGWTALYLYVEARAVTMVDGWGPGNSERLRVAKPA